MTGLLNFPLALNAVLGSILIVGLIFINYIRKYSIDRFQRGIFLRLLLFHFITMASDMLFMQLEGYPGRLVYFILYITRTLYYLFQVLSFCYMVVFVDYVVFTNVSRSKKIIWFSYIYFFLRLVILFIADRYNLFFYIDPEKNIFMFGKHYYIRFVFGYFPLLLALGIFIRSYSSFKKSHIIISLVLMSFFILGSGLDYLFGTIRLVWPWGTSALLYSYFFIVQSDSRIDPLTGIGNRFSFNEFTDKLSRRITGESWAVVMIDMDHFKMINDTLGHQEGDNALRDMAAILKSCTGRKDFAARYGGDEFVLTTKIGKGNENGVTTLTNKIQAELDQYNAKNVHPFKLEISYGYGVYTADGKQSVLDFLNQIDGLMYKNKQERRRHGDQKNGAAG